MNSQNVPARYNPQMSGQQRGPYIEVTCAVRSDFTWRIPFFPGRYENCCPACFGKTYVHVYVDGVEIHGEETWETKNVDKIRLMGMRFQNTPMFPLPGNSGSLDDLLNSLG
jgi:hypothetical protein